MSSTIFMEQSIPSNIATTKQETSDGNAQINPSLSTIQPLDNINEKNDIEMKDQNNNLDIYIHITNQEAIDCKQSIPQESIDINMKTNEKISNINFTLPISPIHNSNNQLSSTNVSFLLKTLQSLNIKVPDNIHTLTKTQQQLLLQMYYVHNARQEILAETHPDIQTSLNQIEMEKNEMIAYANLQYEYFQQRTEIIFTYECQDAMNEYKLHCEKLRQDMLEEIQHEMDIIQDQRKGISTPPKVTRKTRSGTRTHKTNGIITSEDVNAMLLPTDANGNLTKIKRRITGPVFIQLEKRLAQSEIDQDLKELNTICDATRKRRLEDTDTSNAPLIKYHRANLLYKDWIFQEGDELYVENSSTQMGFVAILCAMTSTELFFLSSKGEYVRFSIMQLRQGEITLRVLTSEQHSAITAQVEQRDAMMAM